MCRWAAKFLSHSQIFQIFTVFLTSSSLFGPNSVFFQPKFKFFTLPKASVSMPPSGCLFCNLGYHRAVPGCTALNEITVRVADLRCRAFHRGIDPLCDWVRKAGASKNLRNRQEAGRSTPGAEPPA